MRDAYGTMLDRALDVVLRFIIERGLILFGGQAIDCALRLKGTQIYPDAQRPDFDFLSARNVDDAYDLAERLANMGFAHVGAVRAIHVQTMRVRVDARWVADVGHVPAEVLRAIPTFDYNGMKVVHPDFQRMDMHLAFCFPFNSPPREDVFHRWRKDLRRINLYEKYYPLNPSLDPKRGLAARQQGPSATSRVRAQLVEPIVELDAARESTPLAPAHDIVIHGFAAYALLRRALDDLGVESATPRLEISFPSATTIELELPLGLTDKSVLFASPRPAEVSGSDNWFDPYLDLLPESVQSGSAVVLSSVGRLIAASSLKVALDSGASGSVRVVSVQYVLVWLLLESHRAPSSDVSRIYRTFYTHMLTVMRDAEAVFAATAPEKATELFADSPFAPTLDTVGAANTDNTYIIKMADNAAKARETLPVQLGVRPDAGELTKGLPPRSYYPGGKPRPVFDYAACPLFRRAGLPRPRLAT